MIPATPEVGDGPAERGRSSGRATGSGTSRLGWLQRSYRVVAGVVLLAGSVASGVYAQQWQASTDRAEDERAALLVTDATTRLRDGFAAYERALGAERAFFAGAEGQISYEQFRSFAASLDVAVNYPGMQGIGFQQQVNGEDLPAFVAENRAQGRPDFTVTPPGRRSEHFIVRFNEPESRLGKTWGFDARSNPTVRPFLERARDSGQVTLSGKAVLGVDLVLSEERQPVAFGLFMPVYRRGAPVATTAERRAAFLGWASSPFRAQDFVNSLFDSQSGTGVQVFDDHTGDANVIAASPAGFQAAGPTTRTATIPVGGRTWVLRFSTVPGAASAARSHGPEVVLVTGVAVSALLAGLLWLFGFNARQRSVAAQALADELQERALVEAELARSEATFRRAFDDAMVGMCLTGIDGCFIRVNAVFAALIGRGVDELVGLHYSVVSHPDDLAVSDLGVGDALAGQRDGFRQHKRYVRPDGSVAHAELSTALMRAPDGTPLHFATQTVDVTERHLAEQERDKHLSMLHSVIANSQSSICVKDLDGRYLLANETYVRVFGVTEAELLGKDDSYLDADLAPVWRANDLCARKGEWHAEEWTDGIQGRRQYESVKVPLLDGDGKLYATCGISLDVTERRRAAAELQTASQAVQEAAQASMEATEAKSRFLATMSHEIRTPMNAVIGMTGLLLDTGLDEQQRQFVEIVRTSGDALLAIINDVLDFTRLGAGQIQLEDHPFDLGDCLDETLSLVAAKAGHLDLIAHVAEGCPSTVSGDSHRLRQVLVNLVGNAVKFTEQGDVFLGVDLASGSGSAADERVRLTFTVRDTGIGIPADRMNRLFQSFSQIDASTTRVYGGSGLGLAISRSIVQAMEGDITVTSTVGEGSTFVFTVALGRCAQAAGVASSAIRTADLGGRRALLVDDNETNRRILRLQMESWGMSCIDIAKPHDALAVLAGGAAFDIALLDMHMPHMDGVQLAEQIRALPGHRDLPMMLLTSLATRPEGEAADLFAAFHTKPIRASRLRAVIADILSPASAADTTSPPPPADATTPSPPGDEQRLEATRPERCDSTLKIQASSGLRVLLAEDSAVNQKVAELMLRKLGHSIDIVGNGREAFDAVRHATYDVVLMDVHMPVMDGLDSARAIRSEIPALRQPRIIALTAATSDEDRRNCERAGMDAYLSKPIRLPDLAGALDDARTVLTASVPAPAAIGTTNRSDPLELLL